MDGIESQFPFYDFGRQQNYQKKTKQNDQNNFIVLRFTRKKL